MDPASLVAAMVIAQTARIQPVAASLMARMYADNSRSVVQVVNAAKQNMATLVNVAAGIGQTVNISL